MSAMSKTLAGALAAAVIALSAAALSPAAARSGEHFERDRATLYQTPSRQAAGSRAQRATIAGVFSDAVFAGRPEVLGIKRRKWMPSRR